MKSSSAELPGYVQLTSQWAEAFELWKSIFFHHFQFPLGTSDFVLEGWEFESWDKMLISISA
jgi:hypothetical protein